MQEKDLRILQYMRENARTNLTTISRKTGIPVSTIFDRLRAQDGGLIKKFTTMLDFAKLGYPVRAKIFLRVTPQTRNKLRGYLNVHPRVNNLWRVNNGFDFATDCVFKSIREAEEFIEELELKHEILDKYVFHIIEDIATEKVLTKEIPLT